MAVAGTGNVHNNKSKIINPFIRKLKKATGSIVAQYLQLKAAVNDLNSRLIRAEDANDRLQDRIDTDEVEKQCAF
jgi:hypothetical protein